MTPEFLSASARQLYADAGWSRQLIQSLRPYICPFHVLIPLVPKGARVLDIGCGCGLFLAFLASNRQIVEGYGFDSDAHAIATARRMQARLPSGGNLRFTQRDATCDWPKESFDVVSLIDVLHHVPPERQAQVVQMAAERVAPGGMLLYKDMVRFPAWRAWGNRMHDLVMAHQWIHYVDLDSVSGWLGRANIPLSHAGNLNMLWYGHEWAIFRRPT